MLADPPEKLASLESDGFLFPHLPFAKSLHREGSARDQDVCYNEHERVLQNNNARRTG
jgi:hypothetical protein